MKWLVVLALAVACGGHGAPARPQPGHRYHVPADVGSLVVDDAAFATFARELRADLEAGEPQRERLFVLAMLDALDDRWDVAAAGIERVRALETDAHAKLMTGLTIRVWADARTPDAFGPALERALATLPIETVRPDLEMLRTMAQVFTPKTCRQLVEQSVHAEAGTVTLADAHAIVFQRYAVKRLVPVASIIDATLAAHGIVAKG